MLAFMMCETKERGVDKLTFSIKSKPKLIQPFLMEIRRAEWRWWPGVIEAHLIFYSQAF